MILASHLLTAWKVNRVDERIVMIVGQNNLDSMTHVLLNVLPMFWALLLMRIDTDMNIHAMPTCAVSPDMGC